MLKELNTLLLQAKKEKVEAMRPYNERIRTLAGAIRNLEKFNEETQSINGNPTAKVQILEPAE